MLVFVRSSTNGYGSAIRGGWLMSGADLTIEQSRFDLFPENWKNIGQARLIMCLAPRMQLKVTLQYFFEYELVNHVGMDSVVVFSSKLNRPRICIMFT